ncbi:MAG: prepilin-type N-terminal cleavage/methylation domain-containing protein [Nitratireductor sp.]|nr:prepilin-type N-terminal cleavage/methylation domain-containing protein [Nitratireductor sp.]
MRRTADEKDREAGFSMIEMLVVLVIVSGVFAAISATVVRRGQTVRPMEAAKQVQALVYQARTDAIARGEVRRFQIIPDQKRFAYGPKEAVELPQDFGINIVTGRELIEEDGTIIVLFLPDGSSSGVDIRITGPDDRLAELSVNWLTGLPKIRAGRAQ